MKQIFTLIFACIALLTNAQVGYHVGDLYLELPNPDPNEIEQVLSTHVKNTSSAQTTLRWVRTTICTDTAYGNSVCIGQNCFEQTTNSKTFSLMPNDSTELSLHLWKNANGNPVATVEVELYPENNPSNAVVVKFVFGLCTSLVVEPGAYPDLKVFPNPAHQYLHIENFGLAAQAEIVNLSGAQVLRHDLSQGQVIDISELPVGQYLVRFSDASGQKRTTRAFAKQ